MKLSRIQFEMAVNRLCKDCVEAYIQHNDQWAVFRRDMSIMGVMAFYDELVKSSSLRE